MSTTIPSRTAPGQRQWNLTAEEKERLLEDLAAKQLPQRVIAAQWGISHSHIRDIASQNKERIAEIRQSWDIQLGDESPVPLWVRDKFNRLALRQGALLKILEQQRALELEGIENVTPEHWAKLETLKQQILRYIDDVEGTLPTRAPAVVAEGSKMTYTVTGVDVAEVVKSWQAPQ